MSSIRGLIISVFLLVYRLLTDRISDFLYVFASPDMSSVLLAMEALASFGLKIRDLCSGEPNFKELVV